MSPTDYKTGDPVQSNGRIETRQGNRNRHIQFDSGTVVDVTDEGVVVNPHGMKAELVCESDDLIALEVKLAADEEPHARKPNRRPDADEEQAQPRRAPRKGSIGSARKRKTDED